MAVWGTMIYISLDPLRSKWLVSTLQQTPIRSKLSPVGYIHVAQIPYTPEYKPWCHGAR